MEVRPNKLLNNIARNILIGNRGVTDLKDVTINGTTFRSQGQIVAVTDIGVDSDYPAFNSRILATIALGRPGRTNDTEGYGTYVYGLVLGNGTTKSRETI